MIMKSLTVRDDQNMISTKMIMQMGDRPPMEMPARMTQARAGKQPADIRQLADEVGPESVTTPAGTFATTHYKMKDGSGDVWVADKAGPFGMVKFDGKDNSMVLTKVETDAKDKITGNAGAVQPDGISGSAELARIAARQDLLRSARDLGALFLWLCPGRLGLYSPEIHKKGGDRMRTDEEKFTRGRVTMREKFSDDLWRFRVDPGEGFKYVAGQYATLGVEKDGKRIERAYSLVSSPYEKELEFFFELVEQGELTPLLFPIEARGRKC